MRLDISPEPAVLGFLLEQPLHGYDLYKQVTSQLGPVWRIGLSRLYALVKTFETRGWVESRLYLQETRPSQKVLTITPAGRQAFADWLEQPAHGLREFRVDFFLRLYFCRLASPAAVERLIKIQLATSERELASLRARNKSEAAEQDLAQLAHSFRIEQLTGIIKWLTEQHAQLVPLPSATTSHKPKAPHQSGVRRAKTNVAHKEKSS